MLEIRAVPGAPLEVNCYLVADPAAGDAILVDAPKQVVEAMRGFAEELGVTIREIVCTHGHFDHVMGLTELKEAFGAPVACHAMDAAMVEHPSTAPFYLPFELTPVTPDRLLEEGDVIAVGAHRFTVLHTSGHTPGGICLYSEGDRVIFTGDTLFAGTCGRIDLPGGDGEQMVKSLQRLRALPQETRFFPGHGPDSTIGAQAGWMQHVEEMEEY